MSDSANKRAPRARHPEREPKAILRRYRQITAALAECFITAGWQEAYRKEDADRFLRYLERRAKGGGRHGKTENELRDFLYLHGQCIDYLYRGNPSVMFCHAAANSAVASVIRENRHGVSDQWSKIEMEDAERRLRQLQEARQFMRSARERAAA
ncbi:MAG: hypothetical protein U1E81_17935 [Xanthobacteraceae bacterium]